MHHTSSPIGSEPIDDSHRLALAAELAGDFDVERQIRRDPWSVVYIARDRAHARPVAIRVLHETVAAGQRPHVDRTVRVLAQLHHPNIVDVHEARWLHDGRLAVVLQWVEGEGLRDVLDDEPLTPECVVEVLHDIARALRVAQSRAQALGIAPDLVHRAVAPEHVLLDRATGSALLDPSLAMLGLADAEPGCLAPELLALRPPTARTDVYTLGVLGWEMLTRMPPGDDPASGGTSSVGGAHAAAPADGTEAILWRAMQQKAAWRWASVDELLSALQPRSLSVGAASQPGDDRAEPAAAAALASPDAVVPAIPLIADAERLEAEWEEIEYAEAQRAEAERAETEQEAFEQAQRAREELEREEAERAKAESAQALLARWSEMAAAAAAAADGGAEAGAVPDETGRVGRLARRALARVGLLGHARAHPALAPALVVSVVGIVAVGGLLLWGPPTSASTPAPRPRRAVPGTATASGATLTPAGGAPQSDSHVTVAAIGGEPVLGAIPRPAAPAARPATAAPAPLGVMRELVARVRRAVGRPESHPAVAPMAAGPAADSVPPYEPRPRVLWGTWHHSDGSRTYARPRFSDVLTLNLNPDGSATLDERRYTLQRSGAWSVAGVMHEGSWEVRDPMLTGSVLCVRWRTPSAMTSCEPASITHDTIPLGPLLTFAGRHWRAGPPPSELPDHPPARGRAKARRHSGR